MTAEELRDEWKIWDVENNRNIPPASLSFAVFMIEVVLPREREVARKQGWIKRGGLGH